MSAGKMADAGILQPDEIELIAVMFRRPPMCPARSYAMQVMAGPSPEQDLDIQLFLRRVRHECKEIWALRRLYEDYRIRCRETDRCRRDPTTQEQDRKNSINRNLNKENDYGI